MLKQIAAKINRKEKVWLSIGLGVLIVFLIDGVIFMPLLSKVRMMQNKIRTMELEVKKGLKIQLRKDEISQEYEKMQVYLKKEEGVSEQELLGNFLKELEKTAQEAGVSVVSLVPLETIEEGKGKIYRADFKAEAGPEKILTFFYKIQENQTLMAADKFSVSPRDKDAQILKLDAVISRVMP